MKHLLALFILFSAGILAAENLFLETNLYQSVKPDVHGKSLNHLLDGKDSQKLFSAVLLCAPDATSYCSLVNHFGFQKAGFSIKLTPARPKTAKKNYRIESVIDWNLMNGGPFVASITESFYEGTVINCVRNLLPDVFSPLGISQSKNVKTVYVPAIRFQVMKEKSPSKPTPVTAGEIVIRITEDGKPPREIRTVPVAHKGKFPARNPLGIKARMYRFRSISILNLYYCHQRGIRKDGTPVLEELDLSLCFQSPAPGSTVTLAEMTSFCFAGNCAFGKMPLQGGKPIKYQVFLTVK